MRVIRHSKREPQTPKDVSCAVKTRQVPRRTRGSARPREGRRHAPVEGVASSARGKGAGAACAHTVGGRAQDAQGGDGGGGAWKWGFPGGGGHRWGRSHSAAPSPDECVRSSSLEAAFGASEGLGEGGPRRDSRGTGSHLHSGTRRGAAWAQWGGDGGVPRCVVAGGDRGSSEGRGLAILWSWFGEHRKRRAGCSEAREVRKVVGRILRW